MPAALVFALLPQVSLVHAATDVAAGEPEEPAEKKADSAVIVKVTGLKDELLKNALGYLEINQLNGKSVPTEARLRYLHRAAEKQIARSLQPFGYFRTEIESSLEQKNGKWQANYAVKKGEAIKVTSLNLELKGDASSDPLFNEAIRNSGLKKDEALNQTAYEALKKRFQVLASERGYFDSVLEKNEIRIDLPNYAASIHLQFNSGQRYKLGAVDFKQSKPWLAEEFLQRYVELIPEQEYEASALQQLQGDLSNTEYYQQVEISASPDKGESLTIPVNVNLTPKKPRRYTYGIGYGTDTGVRVKAGINGRRVNQWGHNYTAEALISEISYGIAGEYVIPGADPRTDAWGIRASYEDEHSDTREYQAFNIGGYYKYRDGLWLKTYALDYHVERFALSGDTPTSALLIPSVDWTRTFPAELEKRIYAANGTWLQLRLKGAHDSLLSDTSLLQPLVAAKWIRSFSHKGRVIARGAIGTSLVSDFEELPTSLRFYTGGDRTVRGYAYNVIGPVDDEDEVIGGKHLIEGSLEYEYPIKNKWSVAVFMDTGDAFDDEAELKSGVGLGLHWASPIGPVRIDLGHGLEQPLGTDIRLHLTIGPDL